MQERVTYRGQPAGMVQIEEQPQGMCWKVECSPVSEVVLRLYGLRENCAPLRIGVLEPEGQTLTLRRVLSWQTLNDAGYDRTQLPDKYVLDDGQPGCLEIVQQNDPALPVLTGDAKIDALADAGQVRCVRQEQGWKVYAPFVYGQETPIAFALTACTVNNGQAILHLSKDNR